MNEWLGSAELFRKITISNAMNCNSFDRRMSQRVISSKNCLYWNSFDRNNFETKLSKVLVQMYKNVYNKKFLNDKLTKC